MGVERQRDGKRTMLIGNSISLIFGLADKKKSLESVNMIIYIRNIDYNPLYIIC